MSGGGGGSENETHVDLLMLCDSRTLCMPQRHVEISVAPIHQPQLDNAVTGLVVKVVVTEKRGADPIQCAASCSITTVTAVSQAVNDNREITSWPIRLRASKQCLRVE